MNPNDYQQQSLDRMKQVLAGNDRAMALAEKLWRFFGFNLTCVLKTDGAPSRYRVHMDAYEKSGQAADVAPFIWLRQTNRTPEALIHELFHLEVIAEGFPRIWVLPPVTPDQSDLAFGVQNLADHVVMLPRYLALGCDAAKFTGPSTLSAYEAQVAAEVAALPNLLTPAGYGASVSGYLQGKVNFRLSALR